MLTCTCDDIQPVHVIHCHLCACADHVAQKAMLWYAFMADIRFSSVFSIRNMITQFSKKSNRVAKMPMAYVRNINVVGISEDIAVSC